MGDKLDNPSAFPHQPLGSDGLPEVNAYHGMNLRDWFAGQALAGLSGAMETAATKKIPLEEIEKAIAEAAYGVADAMLAARKDSPHG